MLRASNENKNGTESTSSETTRQAGFLSANTSEATSSNFSKVDTVILYENLTELHTAYKYVTLIIDDIVSQATSYTQVEFEKILENNSAICSISLSEYSKAIRASEIISKVNSELELNCGFNYLSLQQAVINTVYTYSMEELANGIANIADRIYIDRDLMKKLMDLHELITETIKKVNNEMGDTPGKIDNTESTPGQQRLSENQYNTESTPIENRLSTNNYNTESIPNTTALRVSPNNSDTESARIETSSSGEKYSIPSASTENRDSEKIKEELTAGNADKTETVSKKKGLKTFTVEPAKSLVMDEPVNKTLTVIPTGDHALQNDSMTNIYQEGINSPQISDGNIIDTTDYTSVENMSYSDELKEKKSDESQNIPADETESIGQMTDEPLPPSEPSSPKHTDTGIFPPLDSSSRNSKCNEPDQLCLDDVIIIDEAEEAKERKTLSIEAEPNELFYPPYDANPSDEASTGSKLKKLFYELSLSVNCLKKKCVLCTSNSNIPTCENAINSLSMSDNTVNLPKSLADFKEEDALNTQQEIIKYLKELYDIKKVLNKIDNPELVVDTSIKDKQQCCTLHTYPHIHAKLNGIAVIIKMTQDTIDVLLAESYTIQENKCACTNKALNDTVVLTTNNNKSTNAFPTQDLQNPELNDSICSLPYSVTKRSLPNFKNSANNSEVDSYKSNMTSQIISFQNEMIKQQLLAVGVDNLVNIAKPAKCCRKPFLDEMNEDDPYHASLNSLPLTNSDMLTIKHLVDHDQKCMNNYNLQSKFAYYTNFQENFASNIEYFIPKPYVIEVRFFEIFRFQEKDKKPKTNRIKTETNHHWNIFEIVRKFTNPDTGTKAEQAETVNICQEARKFKNERSQTEESEQNKICEPSKKSLPHKPKRKKLIKDPSKTQKDSCIMCNMGDTSSLSPKNYADTLSGIYEIGSDGKVRTKPKENLTRSTTTMSSQKTSQNLGTIYEFEEKHQNPLKDQCRENDSIYNMLNKLELTESYQKFIASNAAIKAFEKSNLGAEQFWNLYFETKKCNKSVNCKKSASSIESANQKIVLPQQKIKLKKKKSRIPKRIKKTNKSDTSSSYSTNNSKKYKIKLKQTDSKIAICEGSSESLTSRNKSASFSEEIKTTKTKILFTDVLEEAAKCHEFLPDSIQSLRVLASKNGPGYITILHPICGCPEVSIFIPCYCDDPNNNELKKPSLTSYNVESLMGSNDGRHIILPKSCRINGYDNCNCAAQANKMK